MENLEKNEARVYNRAELIGAWFHVFEVMFSLTIICAVVHSYRIGDSGIWQLVAAVVVVGFFWLPGLLMEMLFITCKDLLGGAYSAYNPASEIQFNRLRSSIATSWKRELLWTPTIILCIATVIGDVLCLFNAVEDAVFLPLITGGILSIGGVFIIGGMLAIDVVKRIRLKFRRS